MVKNNPILYRQINGALKSTIASHGPITKKWTSSAAKRIIGNLKKYQDISYPDEFLKEKILEIMAIEHEKLLLLRKRLESNTDGYKKSHIAGRLTEKRYILLLLNNLLKKKNFSLDANVLTDIQQTKN